jgi:hypothetical protein
MKRRNGQITAGLYFMDVGVTIRGDQSGIAEIRAGLKRVGRSALARKFGGWLPPAHRYLKAPKELVEIAGFLWRNEPMIIFERNSDAQPNAKPTVTKYLERFTLKYSELPRTRFITNDLARQVAAIAKMYLAKIQSDVRDRWRKAINSGRAKEVDVRAALREILIKSAWLYPLHEWACIFPDAAAAGDHQFITEMVEAAVSGKYTPPAKLDGYYGHIAGYWHDFNLDGLARSVPGLKHWSEKAACEFVSFRSRHDLELRNYRHYKKGLQLHSEKPTLVSRAEYVHDGELHELRCRR